MITLEKREGIDFEEQRKIFGIENLFVPNKVKTILGTKQLIELVYYVKQYPKIIIDLIGDNIDEDYIITDIDVDFHNNITISFVEHFDIEGKEKPSSITIGNDKISDIAKRVETHKFLLKK